MSNNPYASPIGSQAHEASDHWLTRGAYTYRSASSLLALNQLLALLMFLISLTMTGSTLFDVPYLTVIATQTSYMLFALIAVSLAWNLCYLIATYRVVANSHVLAKEPPELSAGFAVGSYFIPIVNLIRPYQAIRDCYQNCGVSGVVLLRFWWATHLFGLFMKQASRQLFRLSRSDPSSLEVVEPLSFLLNVIQPVEILALGILSHLALSRLAAKHEAHIAEAARNGEWVHMSPWSHHVSSWGAD